MKESFFPNSEVRELYCFASQYTLTTGCTVPLHEKTYLQNGLTAYVTRMASKRSVHIRATPLLLTHSVTLPVSKVIELNNGLNTTTPVGRVVVLCLSIVRDTQINMLLWQWSECCCCCCCCHQRPDYTMPAAGLIPPEESGMRHRVNRQSIIAQRTIYGH